jgi:hypothetical protein
MRDSYTPVRKLHSRRSDLGVNVPANGKRFGRMADAFRESAAYWGEHGEWFIVAAQHRDSDTLDRSNFAVLLKQLGGESESVAVERANHWAVGWCEYLIIRPDNRKALRHAIHAHSAVTDYPILDESHWSELEYSEGWELAEGELKGFTNWETEFSEAMQNYGYGDDELWSGIELARERLKELEPLWESHASCPIDPCQLKMFDDVPHLAGRWNDDPTL